MSTNTLNLVTEANYSDKMATLINAVELVGSVVGATVFQGVSYSNNTLSFYGTPEKTDTPVTINLPEEMFLDQANTTIVNPFAWSDNLYPGSVDPDLDGLPVMVLAVKGDASVSYSFVALPSSVTIDSEMSGSSTNTVENKVIKSYADSALATGFKQVEYSNNTIRLYKTTGKTDTPVTISLPEEKYIDLVNTTVVTDFTWSNVLYPGSVDPDLDGKVVFAVAQKTDAVNDTYKFIQLPDATNVATETVAGLVKPGSRMTVSNDGSLNCNLATTTTPGIVIPGEGFRYDETTGVLSVVTSAHSITYELNGGTNAGSNPALYSYDDDPFTLADPTRTGYIFLGWTGSNGNVPQKNVLITPSTSSTDLSYTANWQAESYTITFDVDGVTSTTTCDYDSKIQRPVDPTKNGYSFKSWQKNGVDYDFDTLVTGPVTLVATWNIVTYNITYTLDGGTNAVGNPSSYDITTSNITLGDATKTGYTFLGWTGSNGETPQKNVTIPSGSYGDKSYTANFTINSYTVTWKQVLKSKSGDVLDTITYYTQQVNYGSTPTSGYPTTVPAISKYTSPDNWVYEGTSTVFDPFVPITDTTNVCAYYVRESTTYAYALDASNSSPTGRVAYPSGVDNEGFTPAAMGSSTFNYGSWPSDAFIFDYFKPCAVKYDGTVDYYLDPNDYSKKIDGTSSDYNNTNYAGNMMVQVNKMYTKRVLSGNVRYFYVSDTKLDNDYECDAFINASGNECDYIYLPLFKGSYSNSKLRSISGQTPQVSTTTATEVSEAAACGAGWQIWDYSSHELIRDLCTLISKSTDSQTAFGYGYANGNSAVDTTGTLYNKGMFWGETGGKQHVKVFHIEDFWGNRYERCLGIVLDRWTLYTKANPPYSYTSISTYTNQGACGVTSNSGWKYNYGKWDRIGLIPYYNGTNGSATTYECDGFYLGSGTMRIAYVGGGYRLTTYAGAAYVRLDGAADYSGSYLGASPLLKP